MLTHVWARDERMKQRAALIFVGILVSVLMAVAVVQLLSLILATRGARSGGGDNVAGLLVLSHFILIPVAMGLVCAFFWRDASLTTAGYFYATVADFAAALVASYFVMGEGIICLIIV